MEYLRTTDNTGVVYQWVDSQIYMVLDTVTGMPERIGRGGGAVCDSKAALEYVASRSEERDKFVIVTLPCIRAFKTCEEVPIVKRGLFGDAL